MAIITDHNSAPREVTVVLVTGAGIEHILGYGLVDDLLAIPSGLVQVIDHSVNEPVSLRFDLSAIDPKELERLRQLFKQKSSVHDLEDMAKRIATVHSALKSAERLESTDRIPVPKQYQRNRFKR